MTVIYLKMSVAKTVKIENKTYAYNLCIYFAIKYFDNAEL